MSLRVWLPLDGNLRQQGISNTIVTSTNTTVNSGGKIGSCYSFNGTNSYLTLNPAPLNNNTQEFTYACWFKPNSVHNACLLSNRNQINSAGITIFYYNTGHWFFDVGSRQDFVPSTNVTVNTWNHIVFVYKQNAYRKMYLNGTEVWSTTDAPAATGANTTYGFIGASANTTTTANGNFLNGYLNDVRIYNHALSAAEIHEISQGLILHYKLDDITNDIEDSSGYNNNGQIIGDLIIEPNGPRYTQNIKWNSSSPTDNSETGICYIQSPLSLTTPLQMTVAWWSKPDNGYNNTSNHGAFCTSNNTSRPTDYNSTAFHHRDSGFDICPSDGSGVKRLTFAYTKGSWHHHAVTYDGNIAKAYQDGVKTSEITIGTNKTLASFSQLYIGYSQAGGVKRKTLGNYSDFRVYVTALTADDILQLYHTSAKVDNKQKLHTFELVENQNKIAIDKQGRVLCKELTENTNTKFYKINQAIDTAQIIEF